MPRIFISYRREDIFEARCIYDHLCYHFGRSKVFLDAYSIPYSVYFRQNLAQAVSRCDVLLAVIGDHWLEMRYGDGPKNGQRRLDAEDFVCIEIRAALELGIPVLPVLVGHASMPREEDLPNALKMFAFHNAPEVRRGSDFIYQLNRLVRLVRLHQFAPAVGF